MESWEQVQAAFRRGVNGKLGAGPSRVQTRSEWKAGSRPPEGELGGHVAMHCSTVARAVSLEKAGCQAAKSGQHACRFSAQA
jgi:hypothetical protein